MAAPRFWREAPSRYNLVASRCGNCGHVAFPPRSFCPMCHRESIGRIERFKLSGKGKVHSFSVVHEVPQGMERMKPYVIALIRMEEGVLLTAQVIDIEPSEMRIGMPVRATLRRLGEDGPEGVIHYGYKFVMDR